MKFEPRLSQRVIAALTQTPSVKKQMRVVANEIRREARALAPKDTGALRRGLSVTNVYDPGTGMVEFRVGWSGAGFYGGIVELGSEDTPARPHLRPAARKVGGVAGRRTGGG